MTALRRLLRTSPSLLALAIVACGGTTPAPATPATSSSGANGTSQPPPPPPTEIPVAVPEVAPAPASCTATKPQTATCKEASDAIAALARAAAAEKNGDAATRDAELASIASCDKLPVLVVDALRAQLAPIACAEATLAPAIEARGKEAFPPHLAAARALVGASRLSRLRPKKGAFDVLARAEVDPKAADAGTKSVLAWKEALEKQESEAIVLSKGAPAEVAAIVRFEAAAAWIAFATELRSTPLPDEIKSLKSKDPDLETRYYAKLDEVTMPVLERARQLGLAGLGLGVRDGVLLKTLPSFLAIVDPFKSRPGFETRATRDLDLQIADPLAGTPSDAVKIAATLPPWAVYLVLERAAPASLLDAQVLGAMAANRGIPAPLRVEVEKDAQKKPDKGSKPDPKLKDALLSPVALSRVRVALAYGSRPDAEAVAALSPKEAVDQLRVAVAKALVGPVAAPPKLGTPAATQPKSGYALEHLDALAKKGGPVGVAAQYDAALLSLDAAQVFGGEPEDPLVTSTDPKKGYEDAIARLDAVANAKTTPPARAAKAKQLADGARETLKLLAKDTPKKDDKDTPKKDDKKK